MASSLSGVSPGSNVNLHYLRESSEGLTSEVKNHIRQELEAIFPSDASYWTEALEKFKGMNAQVEGWTLLHYCSYQFSYQVDSQYTSGEVKDRLMCLIEYMIEHGGDIESQDEYGRTPIYFASGLSPSENELNDRFWSIFSSNPGYFNPANGDVQPLHTVASLSSKFVIDLVKGGAETGAIDKFGRMPLHCAVIHSTFDKDFLNVRCLTQYELESIEHEDCFNNTPLYYAAILGSEKLLEFMLDISSVPSIDKVLKKLQEDGFLETDKEIEEFETDYCIYDPIYNVPPRFKVYLGGMPKGKKNKKTVSEKMQNASSKKKTQYQDHDTYSDGHSEKKHLINEKKYKAKFSDGSGYRKFAISTKSSPAKFLPEYSKNYTQELEKAVKKWVDNGAVLSQPYVEYSNIVGADNGELTQWVEIYFTESGGAQCGPSICVKSKVLSIGHFKDTL